MNIYDILILIILAVCVALAFLCVIIKKRNGASCCGNCANCHGCFSQISKFGKD